MNRPVVIYLVMIVVLIAGLWAVLEIGARLTTAEDLAGKWELHPTSTGSDDKAMTIEQSGKFFQVSFDQGQLMDLKLAETSDQKVLLSNAHLQLQVTGKPDGDDKTFTLTGDRNGQWTAHRVIRTFPADVSTKADK